MCVCVCVCVCNTLYTKVHCTVCAFGRVSKGKYKADISANQVGLRKLTEMTTSKAKVHR